MYSRTPGSKRANPKNPYQSQTQNSSAMYSSIDDHYGSSGNGGGAGGCGGYYPQSARASGAKKFHPPADQYYQCQNCDSDLMKEELQFYPCSCSFRICQLCYKFVVESRDSICPYCEKKYKTSGAYNSQSYLQRQQASQSHYNHKYGNGFGGMHSSSTGQGNQLASSRSAQAQKISNSAQSVRQVKHISQNYDTISSSNVSSYSQKQNSQSGYSYSNTSNHNYYSGNNNNAYYNNGNGGGSNYQSSASQNYQTSNVPSGGGGNSHSHQVSAFVQSTSKKGQNQSSKQMTNHQQQIYDSNYQDSTPKKLKRAGESSTQSSSQKEPLQSKPLNERKTLISKDKSSSLQSKQLHDKSQSNTSINQKDKKDSSAEPTSPSPVLSKAQSELHKSHKLKIQPMSSQVSTSTANAQSEQRDLVSCSTEQKSTSGSQTRSSNEEVKNQPSQQAPQQIVKQSMSQPNLMQSSQPVIMIPPQIPLSIPTPTMNPAKLSSVRILQKHILYAIGLSPSIAKEEILRKYEFFGQYGQITNVLINKDKVYNADNQLQSYSAFISYQSSQEASIGILAVDQFSYEGRMIKASFGRTKYCKFFLKGTACLNKECPYQHVMCDQSEILTQDDMQKSQIFQQYYALAFQLSCICFVTEDQFKQHIKMRRKSMLGPMSETIQTILPIPESIYDKKALFKQFEQYKKQNQQHFKLVTQQYHQHAQMLQQQQQFFMQQHQQQQYVANQQHQQQLLMQAAAQLKEEKAGQIMQAPSQGYQAKAAQSRNNVNQLLSVSSQGYFQMKNKTQAQLQSNFLQQEQMLALQEKLEADLQSQENSAVKNSEAIKKVKRNNSTDKLIEKDNTQNQEDRSEEQKILRRQIKETFSQFQGSSNSNSEEHSQSSHQEDSKQNSEKQSQNSKSSHFIQDGDQSSTKQIREKKRSRRSSVGQGYKKKGSMREQLFESLKFLIDDNDVLPNKRESLIQKQDTKLPSEFLNVQTPGQSHFGGQNEEDHYWNSTLFSQNEFSNQKQLTGFDEKSSYSYQGQHNSQLYSNDKKNGNGSQMNSSYYNQHQQIQIRPFIETGCPNTRSLHNNGPGQNFFSGLGPQNQSLMQSNSNYYQLGRKTTLVNEQTTSSIVGDNKSQQMMRSPSQPNYEKLQLGQMASRNGLNTPYHPSQTSLTYKNSTIPFQEQPKQSFSVADNTSNKPSYELNQQNLDLLDKQYYDNSTSKDQYYAKIFTTQAGTTSQYHQISSQSLFCYHFNDDDSDIKKQSSKFSERGGQILVPRTPVKISRDFLLDDYEYDNTSQSQGLTKQSEAKNYYQEFLSVKESSVFSGNFIQKRRNSLEQERDKLNPKSLHNTLYTQVADNQTDNGRESHPILESTEGGYSYLFQGLTIPTVSHSAQKKSKSRSKNRKTVNTMISSDLTKE